MSRWHCLRTTLAFVVTVVLVGCASPAVVEDHLESDGAITTEFSVDDREIVLTARFDTKLAADDAFMVRWLFPDGSIYLRKPVRRSADSDYRIDTSIPVRGKAPARAPGIWQVQLWRGSRRIVSREFEIREQTRSGAAGAVEFAGLGYCGPSRWSDPVISARRSTHAAAGIPGAWIGREVLDAAGATYSSVILLTGCAPS